jgi:putative transposase
VLVEAHDQWQISDRRYLSEGSMALLARRRDAAEEVAQPALNAS